ncbi:AAA family ATPase [Fervidicoccus fontis]|uniref:Rad50 zinc hook domain protein n=1 Tax=Fervidicoccus fontis (strain DSM 19380 / JCM 18336 / VKM B-2539 / Kam940) TaxID=1163730 RepID=I0A1C6_FERFK|nr:SMC family ATPase [Fervidicoccus fontis]AFH42783.1 Rad50 zinc hook domain protein [Fervidicoccus fontis Kam940]
MEPKLSGLILSSVTLENFRNYSERTTLNFGKGITVLVGENGAGKSSIVEAILFALTGELLRGTIEQARTKDSKKKYFEVELELKDRDNTVIKILRRRKETGEAEDELRICYCCDEEKRFKLIARGANGVNEKIRELLLSDENSKEKDFFKSIIRLSIIGQGELINRANALQSNSASKLDFIDIPLGLSSFEKANKKLGEFSIRLENISDLISSFTYKVNDNSLSNLCGSKKLLGKKLSELKNDYEKKKAELESLEKERAIVERELKMMEEKEKELNATMENLLSKSKELEQARSKRDEKEARFKLLKNKLEENEARLKELEEKTSKKDDIINKVQAIRYLLLYNEAKNCLEYIKEIYNNYKDYSASLNDLKSVQENIKQLEREEKELERNRAMLVSKREQIEKIKADLEKYENEAKKYLNMLDSNEADTLKGKDLETKIVELKDQFKAKIEDLQRKISFIESSLKTFKEYINEIKRAEGRCPLCGRELNEEHKVELIHKFEEAINNNINEKKRLENELKDLKSTYEKAYESKNSPLMKYLSFLQHEADVLKEEDIEKINSEIEEIERKISENESTLEIMKKIENAYRNSESCKRNLISIGKMLEFEQISAENIELLEKIVKEYEKLGEEYLSKTNDGNIEISIEAYNKYKKILQEISNSESLLDSKKKDMENIKNEFNSLKLEIEELDKKIESLRSVEEELKKVRSEIDAVEKDIQNKQRENGELVISIDTLKKELAEYEEKIKSYESGLRQIDDAIYKLNVLLKVRELYDKENIPKWLRNEAIAILSNEMSNTLSKLDLTYTEVDIDENLNIELIDKNSARSVLLSQASGGESVAVAIAFVLAMQKVIQKMIAGEEVFDFLILDEPTTHLDDERVRDLVEVFRTLGERGEGVPQLIIVTHDEQLKEAGDAIYEVKKIPGKGSFVSEVLE